MPMLLSELAEKLGLILQGEDREFTALNTLEAADETEVSFLANPKYAHFLDTTKACAVIVDKEHAVKIKTALISSNPYYDFARAASLFEYNSADFDGVSDWAFIHPGAVLGKDCTVHPFVYIANGAEIGAGTVIFPGVYIGENCSIGSNCILFPNAVVLAKVVLGDCCILHSGAVLGTEGFGFARVGGEIQKIPQIGTVKLESGVDVGANTCIDRSTLGTTSVGKDSKIDNLVQIGHNVRVGEQCLLISQVGIAGSTRLGDRVTVAGQAGIAGHLEIAGDVTIGPQSGVAQDIADGVKGGGTPFMDSKTFLRSTVLLPKLPSMQKRIQQLEKELEELKSTVAALTAKETI